MRLILRIVSLLSLLGLILPSFLFLTGHVTDLNQVKWYMLIATVIWFATATPVMWKEKKA
jgi:hypothetical protein